MASFSPSDQVSEFYSDVSESVSSTIERCVQQFEGELMLLARNKKIQNIKAEDVHAACENIGAILTRHFQKNLAKFKLYCDRNIFVPRNNDVSAIKESASSSSSLSAAQVDASLAEITAEVDQLRNQYLEQLHVFRTLTADCNDSAVLLKDMRHALFNLQLSSNVDDDFILRSSAGKLIELHRSLHSLTDNASSLLYEIQSAVSISSDRSTSESSKSSLDINIRDASDISALNMAIK